MLTLLLASLAAAAPIDACRDAWRAVDAERTIAACSLAGAAIEAPASDRVDALRVLGAAFVLQDRIDLAESAYRAMLALDPHATLGDDAGPKAQTALARAAAALAPAPPAPTPAHASIAPRAPQPPP